MACLNCGKELKQKSGERVQKFRVRKYCNHKCNWDHWRKLRLEQILK